MMKAYFKDLDRKYYDRIIREELSSPIINYLNKKTGEVYICELATKYDKINKIMANNVTVYERRFLSVFNKKICEIVGKEFLIEWLVQDKKSQYPVVHSYSSYLTSKSFDEKIISGSYLEDLVSDINYPEVLNKAESRKIEKKQSSYFSKLFMTKGSF